MSDAKKLKDESADALGNCPYCGAGIPFAMPQCWLCGTNLVDKLPPGKVAYKPHHDLPDRRNQYTLSTLMLGITLLCVCFGLLAIDPGLGILVVIIALPAFVRTARYAGRRRILGTPLRPHEKALDFLLSAGIAFVTITAASIAFSVSLILCAFVLCFAIQQPGAPSFEAILVIGVGGSFVVALIMTVLVIRNTWPRRRDS